MNKFNIGSFDQIAKVNKAINKEVKKTETPIKKNIVLTQEIDLSRFNLKQKNKDIKLQKSLALNKSTIKRLQKLAKICNTSVSEIANKAIREALEMDVL